ncbi:MAG: DUF2846 domain-containing protein [Bacteroidales bacterium]|nr:DUF2846 domain-containing protein [Bacteroidales bacterium]
MRKLAFALLVLPLLIGCASTSKAPVERSEEAKRFEKHPDKAVVYLYRTGRVVGAAGQIQVKINGIEAGGTGPGTFFRWELNPGTYSFMSSTAESSRVVELNVKAGEHYFLRQDARVGVNAGRVTLVEKDEKAGMKEINGCQLIVSAYKQE